jgi:hypothetical protein
VASPIDSIDPFIYFAGESLPNWLRQCSAVRPNDRMWQRGCGCGCGCGCGLLRRAVLTPAGPPCWLLPFPLRHSTHRPRLLTRHLQKRCTQSSTPNRPALLGWWGGLMPTCSGQCRA